MKRLLYIVYVVIVVMITAVAGRETDSRHWGGSGSGRSGWSSGGGHK